LWRRKIDNDLVHGPFGHRGANRASDSNITKHITLTTNNNLNNNLNNELYKYAVNMLKLETVT
jgi:carbamoylphosphate synthase small subunit